MTIVDVIDHLGEADQIREITGGELELLYQDTIFRFHNSIFVEGTLPDRGPVIIDQIPVINIFQWLSGLDDVIDRARFLVSLEKSIAYDYRHANAGSITVFQQGHWDGLI